MRDLGREMRDGAGLGDQKLMVVKTSLAGLVVKLETNIVGVSVTRRVSFAWFRARYVTVGAVEWMGPVVHEIPKFPGDDVRQELFSVVFEPRFRYVEKTENTEAVSATLCLLRKKRRASNHVAFGHRDQIHQNQEIVVRDGDASGQVSEFIHHFIELGLLDLLCTRVRRHIEQKSDNNECCGCSVGDWATIINRWGFSALYVSWSSALSLKSIHPSG
ncbi:hypothetical protein B0H19DRAFT_1156018 [Mycena capillaripes]|nr:hypothetical protein B0H19DRAFT_1156018 [Mycena capillaripes]